ncbi:MAG: hypothetical protein AAB656_04435 [Patescibacteria group bacterium]
MNKLTESEVSKAFFTIILKNVDDAWPEVYGELRRLFGKEYDFQIKDEDNAKMSLACAIIALELRPLEQLFPERVGRIYKKSLEGFQEQEDRIYVHNKIQEYREKFLEFMERYSKNPHHVHAEPAAQLLKDWFGNDINKIYLKDFNEINPVIPGILNSMVIHLVGFWKNINSKFEVIDDNAHD